MSKLYRRYLNLVQAWPVDATKDGRDFGQFLRKKTVTIFNQGELTTIDERYWEPRILALERIARDVHRDKHRMLYEYSATNCDAESARKGVSNEALKTKTEIGLISEIKSVLNKE
ncbi:ubiquinol-cytochrome-c reductase complex assembly factor 2 [Tetranychus urticae]|nr:ubiquinol-cytochrome-c reductase complex assembly factor 2 [Tetranychus urticae]